MQLRWASALAVTTTIATSLVATAPAHADDVPPTADLVLLADTFSGPAAGDPRHLTAVGRTLFFTANDADHGRELWISDGRPEGTRLLADITPGVRGSNPTGLTLINDRLFFTAADPDHGRELWTSDGTPAGTRLLADIAPGVESSAPQEITYGVNALAAPRTRAYFSADDGVHGRELWTSDGTAEGTALVTDISPGAAGSNPAGFALPPSKDDAKVTTTVFAADDGSHGRELWRATTTAATLQADIRPGPVGSSPTSVSGGRVMVRTGEFPLVYLAADDGSHGREPWVSFIGQGLPTRTIDLRPGVEGSDPQDFREFADETVRINADDGAHGRELFRLSANWPLDGYADKAELVADLNPGPASADPHNWLAPHEVGRGRLTETPENWTLRYSRAYTVAKTAAGMSALHTLDMEYMHCGCSAGWRGIAAIEPATIAGAGSNPGPSVLAGSTVVYAAGDREHGRELWMSAGHAANTGRLADIRIGSVGSDPKDLVAIGTNVFLSADDGSHGRELWRLTTPRPVTVSMSGPKKPTSSEPSTFTISVAPLLPGSDPTGTVRVWEDGEVVFRHALPRGERSITWTTTLSPGRHRLTATYGGDVDLAPATSAPWINPAAAPATG